MTLASRIDVMHQGEVQQFDEPETIYNRPANMFVAGFMGSPSMNFISADLGEAGGGKPAGNIVVGQGNSATLPLHGLTAGRAGSTARKVVLGIRPEHLSRYRSDIHASKPGIATITAPVEVVEPTGAETMAVIRVGDREVVGRFTPDEAPRMGEQMTLAVDMTRACLFDPQTQKLI